MVNKNPPPDERVVYLALKNVFKGQNAEVRQNKVIRKLINNHRGQEDVADLIRECNLDVVCNSARTLLCDEIFASTLKAKIRFPELFDIRPLKVRRGRPRKLKLPGMRRTLLNTPCKVVGTILNLQSPDHQAHTMIPKAAMLTAALEASEQSLVLPTVDQTPNASKECANNMPSSLHHTAIPPLFPVYLPFEAQHRVLVHLQSLLELTCYEFGKQAMPETLRRRGWDCAEAVELNRWTEEFTKSRVNLPAKEGVKKSLSELFRSIANIRHTAVHRLRVSAKGIEQFLLDAEALAMILGGTRYAGKIKKLRQHTMETIEELQRNKQFLRSRLDTTLSGIAAQREELKQLEDMAIAQMQREDGEYQVLAGRSIGEAISPSEASFSTAIETERDTGSRLDDTDELDDNDYAVNEVEDDWDVKVQDSEG